MVYAPEVSSTCRVKSESGDWVTENWGLGTRACPLGGLGGPGRAWGGAGETGKSCGEGASCEGHPLPSFPGVGGTAPRTEHCGTDAGNPSVPGSTARLASSVFVLAPAAFEAGTQVPAYPSVGLGPEMWHQTSAKKQSKDDGPARRIWMPDRLPASLACNSPSATLSSLWLLAVLGAQECYG